MGHVILKEFYRDRTVPYFDEYVRKFTDLPFLVKLEDTGDRRFAAGMLLRASDLKDDFGVKQKAEWYPITIDDPTGELVTPNGSIGSRWNNEGRWNLECKDVRTGKPFTPRLSLIEHSDDVVTLLDPYFGGADYQNPHFAATRHADIIEHKVPVIHVETKDGVVCCANVFDLLMAHYGIDRGLGREGHQNSPRLCLYR